MNRGLVAYWLAAWGFAVLFGEVITGVISRNSTFFQYAIPITIYYGVLTLVFAILFGRMRPWIVLIIIFVYGGLAEALLFRGLPLFPVAGVFYVFLFGVPYRLTRRFRAGVARPA